MSYTTHADLGGRSGYGPVVPEPEGVHFHASWEPRALALTLAMGATGAWNIDMSRRARETLPDYAQLGYYGIWAQALQVLLRERGLVAEDELAAARALHPPLPLPRVLRADAVAAALARGTPTARDAATPTRFAVGDTVRLRADAVPHHTRLPGYARGKRGRVVALHGAHVFADTHAHGLGEQPQWLCTVAFDGAELWGDEPGARGVEVTIDAWEPYLEAAP